MRDTKNILTQCLIRSYLTKLEFHPERRLIKSAKYNKQCQLRVVHTSSRLKSGDNIKMCSHKKNIFF